MGFLVAALLVLVPVIVVLKETSAQDS